MKELKPVRERPEFYDQLEKVIMDFFKAEIYNPILSEVVNGKEVLRNSLDELLHAFNSGRIYYSRGTIKGKFNATISKELRKLGAEFSQKHGGFRIKLSALPMQVKVMISTSEARFDEMTKKVDKKLQSIMPDEIVKKISLSKTFEKAMYKINGDIEETLKGISVKAKLTPEEMAKIAEDYQNNLRIYIKDFMEEEIVKLRQRIQKNSLQGNRYETLVKEIQRSYGVSQNKAKFLARQETSLYMAKFKEVRYKSAGINQYRWQCVVGNPNHPVRPYHKKNDGKIYSWDDPPTIDEKGTRKNPGEDYNCRCIARPIVRFDDV